MRFAVMALFLIPFAAQAETRASGEALRAAIIGNTVEGAMMASGRYAEFYAPDGSIRGEGYQGRWSFDGDRMCFAYGEDPATCWAADLSGNKLTWLGAGGAEGSGTIRAGNPAGW